MPFLNDFGEPCGYLDILTEENKFNYLSRFAIIKISERKLYFYKDNPKLLPSADVTDVIDLKKASMVDECSYDEILQPFVFNITITGKDLYFKTKNDKDRHYWISIIKGLLVVLPSHRPNSVVIKPLLSNLKNSIKKRTADSESETEYSSLSNNLHTNISDLNDKFCKNRCVWYDSVFKEGYCKKVGYYFKSWKSRYFVLNQQGLSYYKSKENPILLRLLEYNDIVDCRTSNSVYTKKDFLFEVVTARRVFYIQATSLLECESWVQLINTNKDKFKYKLEQNN